MKTNHEHFFRASQRGNALIYILLAIVLFAGLSFVLSRQSDTGEAGSLGDDKAELYATQIISYASQAQQVIEQMLFTGGTIDDLDFTLPSDGTYNDPPLIYKVYHPEGGGLLKKDLPAEVAAQISATPPAGWYLGAFNNVEWTTLGPGNTAGTGGAEAPYTEVILVAHQIAQSVCQKINEKLGVTTIPNLTGVLLKNVFIDDATTGYGGGVNADLTTRDGGDNCTACDGRASLCVTDGSGAYSFYSVIADR